MFNVTASLLGITPWFGSPLSFIPKIYSSNKLSVPTNDLRAIADSLSCFPKMQCSTVVEKTEQRRELSTDSSLSNNPNLNCRLPSVVSHFMS